jgi:two-component system KDP operon response regulator KdpE
MQTPLNVLVCEEDHAVSELLRTLLEPDGFFVVSAGSVASGIDHLGCAHSDVIVLVLDLPGQDGLEACRRFRRCSPAPILVLSSNGKPNFAEQVLDAGADDYLVKPINNTLVIASLNKLARRARVERDAGKLLDDPTL